MYYEAGSATMMNIYKYVCLCMKYQLKSSGTIREMYKNTSRANAVYVGVESIRVLYITTGRLWLTAQVRDERNDDVILNLIFFF